MMGSGHLVVSVGGGPLAFIYGTPVSSPQVFSDEMKRLYEESKALSIEIICVDPATNAPYSDDLDPQKSGFMNARFDGGGWRAKMYSGMDREGVTAGFHDYCGSSSTNLNGGKWQKIVDERYIQGTLEAIQSVFPGLRVVQHTYGKDPESGMVDGELQNLTRVPENNIIVSLEEKIDRCIE